MFVTVLRNCPKDDLIRLTYYHYSNITKSVWALLDHNYLVKCFFSLIIVIWTIKFRKIWLKERFLIENSTQRCNNDLLWLTIGSRVQRVETKGHFVEYFINNGGLFNTINSTNRCLNRQLYIWFWSIELYIWQLFSFSVILLRLSKVRSTFWRS